MTTRNTIINVADNIRKIRYLRGYKQEYIAEMIGISQSGYAKIESGRSSISIEKLCKIADILEVDIIQFFNTNEIGLFQTSNHKTPKHNFSYNSMIKKQEEEILFLRKIISKKKI